MVTLKIPAWLGRVDITIKQKNLRKHFCEILIAKTEKVLLIIILKRKTLINIYFLHT